MRPCLNTYKLISRQKINKFETRLEIKMSWTLTFVIRETWAYQRQKNTDTAQAVQQVSQVAGAAQLTALLHCCSLVLNISSTVHVSCVVQHAPSSSLCIVAEH